ncbi:hypothetical protein [Actinoplanes sp. NPDC049802]|uniref:hypothetical protein n=1 Tax=Actinoplanes sp. NPDC049802 TaxID=3154742 RepID=UPI00340BD12B
MTVVRSVETFVVPVAWRRVRRWTGESRPLPRHPARVRFGGAGAPAGGVRRAEDRRRGRQDDRLHERDPITAAEALRDLTEVPS